MRRTVLQSIVAASFVVACGGDSTEPAPNLVTNGSFSAIINGTAWSAVGPVLVTKTAKNTAVAIVSVSPTYGISLAISPLTTPGTFSLAFLNPGSVGFISSSTGAGWTTLAQGGTGTATVTMYTANRIAGTFSFDAVPSSGGASGTVRVTNGAFDITY
jgi:hypothetical protein